MIGDLPTSVTVAGHTYAVRTNYRDILRIFQAFDDPELNPGEKVLVCLKIFYKNFSGLPQKDYQDAYNAALEFIDHGSDTGKGGPRTMDWEQDENLIFPAINRAAGFEVRSRKYIHWWTFCGYFMEIKDSTYATILALRQKKVRRKKFEKWEQEFWHENKKACEIRPRLTKSELEEKERLNKLLAD